MSLPNASPECLAILQARLPLEKMVGYARGQVAFYEPLVANEFARQELAFNRTLLTDAVNNLATFDIARLTDECQERLTNFGVEFAYPKTAEDVVRRMLAQRAMRPRRSKIAPKQAAVFDRQQESAQ